MRRIISCIPNAITSLNLLAGCIAVIFAFNLDVQYGSLSGQEWLYVCIAASALFDFCDGLSARLLKAYSNIGAELDSLADLISFGLAPAMMMLNIIMKNADCPAWALVALMIPVCGALRLAKFNVDTTQSTVFKGLPIPANALFWLGMGAWIDSYVYPGTVVVAICIVLVSLLMVANLPMFSLKFKNLSFYDNVKRYGIVIAAISFVVIYGVSGLMWTILLYILISFFTRKHPE